MRRRPSSKSFGRFYKRRRASIVSAAAEIAILSSAVAARGEAETGIEQLSELLPIGGIYNPLMVPLA